MAVDYISMLNAGSGLNTTQIVDALVDAERAPREEKIQAQVEEANRLDFRPRQSQAGLRHCHRRLMGWMARPD